jgi:hypothetical protein
LRCSSFSLLAASTPSLVVCVDVERLLGHWICLQEK